MSLTVGQLIVELEERDREAPAKIKGLGDTIDIETTDDGNVLIIGENNVE